MKMLKMIVTKMLTVGLLGLALTGCQAPAAAPLARLSTAAAALTAPRGAQSLDGDSVRRVLATSGSQATLWGLTFYEASAPRREKNVVRYIPKYKMIRGVKTLIDTRKVEYDIDLPRIWQAKYNESAEGGITYLGEKKFIYDVPEDKVLVLNTADFAGSVAINGFKLRLASDDDDRRTALHYLFGPGETVVFTFTDKAALSGYTADPALFAGMATFSGAAK